MKFKDYGEAYDFLDKNPKQLYFIHIGEDKALLYKGDVEYGGRKYYGSRFAGNGSFEQEIRKCKEFYKYIGGKEEDINWNVKLA